MITVMCICSEAVSQSLWVLQEEYHLRLILNEKGISAHWKMGNSILPDCFISDQRLSLGNREVHDAP